MIFSNNIWGVLLQKLNVPYTNTYINNLYNSTFDYNNLYGTSKMLDKYNVEHAITYIEPEDLISLEKPIITSLDNQIIIVNEVNKEANRVIFTNTYLDEITIGLTSFFEKWNKLVLIAEPDAESIEPNYRLNRMYTRFQNLKIGFVIVFFIMLLCITFTKEYLLFKCISILFNLLGIYFSFQLILKSLKIKTKTGDRLCSLIEKNKCEDVIDFGGFDFLKIVDLGVVGFSYFLFNIVLLAFFFDQLQVYLSLSLLSLPFTVWSIWSQKFVIKKWCALCLFVQALLWVIFLFNVFCIRYNLWTENISVKALVVLGLGVIIFIAIDFIKKHILQTKLLDQEKQKSNYFFTNLKVIRSVFDENKLPVIDSILYIGRDTNFSLHIKIVLSFHCNICRSLVESVYNCFLHRDLDLKISFIIYSREDDNALLNCLLNLAKEKKGSVEILEFILDWYQLKDNLKMIEKYKKYDYKSQSAIQEMEQFSKWILDYEIYKVPLIYVNDVLLEHPFDLESVINYSDLYKKI
ncbi:MAG: vitamin K epoxide reductase family protein [Dysgonamonadaceae bacterium]